MFKNKFAMEIKRIKVPSRSISGENKALCDLGWYYWMLLVQTVLRD